MKLKVSDDKKFLIVDDCSQLEMEQIESTFTKKVENWFIIKKKIPHWDGEVKFIDRYNRIPIGLWAEVKALGKKYNSPISIEESGVLTNPNYREEDVDEWIEEFFETPDDFYPRYYQIEGLKRIIKFRLCTEEISTSGGKTFIAYMIFRYLLDRGKIKKMLYVVPNVDLVTQTEEKFYEYEERTGHKPKWKSWGVYSEAGKPKEKFYDITFGTYQSLSKRGVEYFKDFEKNILRSYRL